MVTELVFGLPRVASRVWYRVRFSLGYAEDGSRLAPDEGRPFVFLGRRFLTWSGTVAAVLGSKVLPSL